MPSSHDHGSKSKSLEPDSPWRCDASHNGTPISQADALAKLNQITQVMFGCDAAAALGDYTYNDQLNNLMKGATITNCMADLGNSVEFNAQVWRIATGAAFDFCAKILGIDQSQYAEDMKNGMVCDTFNPATTKIVNFGWMISSLVQDQAYINLDPDCNHLPDTQPQEFYSTPCPTTQG